MKTKKRILVGIDYTKSSENALHYALMLAKKTNASVTLLHVFEFPLIHTNSGLYVVDYKAVKERDLHKLEHVKTNALKKFPKATIECINTTDTVKGFIKDLAKKKKIDYVILGLETKNKISKFIYGTTSIDLASKIDCPIIIVPEAYKKHQLIHASITVDNKESIKKRIIKKALDFTHAHKCDHQLIHIKTEDEFLMVYEKNTAKENKKWHVKTFEAKDFNTGVNTYAKGHKTDLIILFSHSHSIFYNFFSETNTKHIAFGSKIPVMSIHE